MFYCSYHKMFYWVTITMLHWILNLVYEVDWSPPLPAVVGVGRGVLDHAPLVGHHGGQPRRAVGQQLPLLLALVRPEVLADLTIVIFCGVRRLFLRALKHRPVQLWKVKTSTSLSRSVQLQKVNKNIKTLRQCYPWIGPTPISQLHIETSIN